MVEYLKDEETRSDPHKKAKAIFPTSADNPSGG